MSLVHLPFGMLGSLRELIVGLCVARTRFKILSRVAACAAPCLSHQHSMLVWLLAAQGPDEGRAKVEVFSPPAWEPPWERPSMVQFTLTVTMGGRRNRSSGLLVIVVAGCSELNCLSSVLRNIQEL